MYQASKYLDLVTDCDTGAANYQNYRPFEKPSCNDKNVAKELHNMSKNLAVKMKDHTSSGRDAMPVIAFLQEYKSACDSCENYNGVDTWLFL